MLAFRGVSPKLASLKQGRALIRETLRSSAQTEGISTPDTPSLRSAVARAFASLGSAWLGLALSTTMGFAQLGLDWLPPLPGEGWGEGQAALFADAAV